MKAARLVVLGIALAAGGLAALLAGRSENPEPAPAPVVQLETVDVLVAKSEIGRGTAVEAGRIGLADMAGGIGRAEFHSQTGPAGCDRAIVRLHRPRIVFNG